MYIRSNVLMLDVPKASLTHEGCVWCLVSRNGDNVRFIIKHPF